MTEQNVPAVETPKLPDLQGVSDESGDGGNRTHATFPPFKTREQAIAYWREQWSRKR